MAEMQAIGQLLQVAHIKNAVHALTPSTVSLLLTIAGEVGHSHKACPTQMRGNARSFFPKLGLVRNHGYGRLRNVRPIYQHSQTLNASGPSDCRCRWPAELLN